MDTPKCRLCGKKKPTAADIFERDDLPALIEDCLHIKVGKKDGMPHHICAECGRKLRSWRTFYDKAHELQTFLVDNMSTADPDKYKCTICSMVFNKSKDFAQHLAEHAGRKFHCPVCERRLASEEGLVRHQEVHAESRNHCCHLCGNLFQTLTCLRQHIRVQHRPQDAPVFSCHYCQKTFVQRAQLELHVRTHTGLKPFRCEQCGNCFPTNGLLQRHIAGVHEKRKRFKCPHCPKEFLYPHNFKDHLARHEGSKEVKCDQCEKSFFTRNALFRHQRVHSKKKPFACDICGKTFADCSNRKRHMHQHSKSKTSVLEVQSKEPEMLLVDLNATDCELGLNTLSGAPLSPPLALELLPELPSSPLQLPTSEFEISLNNY